jgi:hypothetical protein
MARKKSAAVGLSRAEALADEVAAYPPEELQRFLSRLFFRLPAEQRLLVDSTISAIPRGESGAYEVGLLQSGRAQPFIDLALCLEKRDRNRKTDPEREAMAFRCYLLRTADPVTWTWGCLAEEEKRSRAAVQGATEQFAKAHPELDPLPSEEYVRAIRAGNLKALRKYDKAMREAVNARRTVSN